MASTKVGGKQGRARSGSAFTIVIASIVLMLSSGCCSRRGRVNLPRPLSLEDLSEELVASRQHHDRFEVSGCDTAPEKVGLLKQAQDLSNSGAQHILSLHQIGDPSLADELDAYNRSNARIRHALLDMEFAPLGMSSEYGFNPLRIPSPEEEAELLDHAWKRLADAVKVAYGSHAPAGARVPEEAGKLHR